jgi:hypothetical protein
MLPRPEVFCAGPLSFFDGMQVDAMLKDLASSGKSEKTFQVCSGNILVGVLLLFLLLGEYFCGDSFTEGLISQNCTHTGRCFQVL